MEIKAEIHFAWQPELQISGSIEDDYPYFSKKTYVVTPRYNCLHETVLMIGHKIWFNGKLWKIIPVAPSYLEHCWQPRTCSGSKGST